MRIGLVGMEAMVGVLFFFLGLVEDFFGLAFKGSECFCFFKNVVRFSMFFEKRIFEDDLDFVVDCLVDRGIIEGRIGRL